MSYDIYHCIYQYIYQVTYLGIFPSKAMSSQIKGVASCLGPSSVIITLPLKCAECSQMIPISARHKVLRQNAVEFCNCPLSTLFCWNPQISCHGFGKILGKF